MEERQEQKGEGETGEDGEGQAGGQQKQAEKVRDVDQLREEVEGKAKAKKKE